MKWPTDKEQHKYMKKRQDQNKKSCLNSKAESWMLKKLSSTGSKWTRQAQWGYRLFDFWNHKLGIAIEVDGKEHRKVYDKIRDNYNYKKSGIVVLRAQNFNEKEASNVIDYISSCKENWNDRRLRLKLKPISTRPER